jgi:FkbM family methyltransferase
MAIEYTTHAYVGGNVTFATRTEMADPHSTRIRTSWKPDAHTLVALQLLKESDHFVDLGANIGTFCLAVAGTTGARGLAVEALQPNFSLLQAGIDANDLSGKVEPLLAAVVEKNGEVRIAGESAYGAVSKSGRRVLAYSLDGLMDEIGWPPIQLVKMDIEGSEMRALEGAALFFEKNPEVIFIFEANGAHCLINGYSPQDLIRFFEARGSHVYWTRGNRVIRRGSGDFQEAGLADYIASPVPLEHKLEGFDFSDFDKVTKLKEVVRTLTVMKPGYRKFMDEGWHLAPDFIRNDKSVQELMAPLMQA